MRKATLAIACAVVLALFSVNAGADTIDLKWGDAYFLGSYHPPEPADASYEGWYIDELIKLGTGGTSGPIPDPFKDKGKDYYFSRVGSTLLGPFRPAGDMMAAKSDPPAQPIDVTGYTYLIGKYDGPNGGGLVWLVSGIDPAYDVTIPIKWDPDNPSAYNPSTGLGLSHYTLFVPDGGATLMLLGGALVGLGALRRRFIA